MTLAPRRFFDNDHAVTRAAGRSETRPGNMSWAPIIETAIFGRLFNRCHSLTPTKPNGVSLVERFKVYVAASWRARARPFDDSVADRVLVERQNIYTVVESRSWAGKSHCRATLC